MAAPSWYALCKLSKYDWLCALLQHALTMMVCWLSICYSSLQVFTHIYWFLQLGLALAPACGMLLGLVTVLDLALLAGRLFQSTEESLPQRAQAEVLQLVAAVVHQVMLTAFRRACCRLSKPLLVDLLTIPDFKAWFHS